MEPAHQVKQLQGSSMSRTTYTTEKLAVIAVALLAVLSPLYIDRRKHLDEEETYSASGSLALWLPLALLCLIVAINIMHSLDPRFMRFDPYWIYRVGGSSCGIVALLLLLAFVLKCKSSLRN